MIRSTSVTQTTIATRTTIVRPPDATLRPALGLALAFAVLKLLIHIAGTLWQRHIGVGYFRDEFYYLMLISTAVIFPSHTPVLQPATYIRYVHALHLPSIETENGERVALPQFFADRYGWQENLDEVTRIVNTLSPEDRARAGIFTGNYGQAAALEWLGSLEHRNLPPVISEHNNYALWGTRGLTGEVMIIDRLTTAATLRTYYDQVDVAGHVSHPLSMPYERHDIFVARHRKMPLAADWAGSRIYF